MRLRSPITKAETPKPKKKTRQFIATTDGKVFPFSMLELSAITKANVNGDPPDQKNNTDFAKDSKQSPEQGDATASNRLASKNYNPELFNWAYNSSVYMRRSVNQIASDVAGRGYTLPLTEGKPESQADLDKINAFLDKPNFEDTIEDVWQKFLIDHGRIGYAGIEVVENAGGEVAELWHMNASRIWRHKDKKTGLFADKKEFGPQNPVWFIAFGKTDAKGDQVHVNKTTGATGEVEFKDRGNEIIFRRLYDPLNSFYGAPPVTPAIGDVVVAAGARDYNISFFLNFGMPSMLITLSGEWEDDTEPDEESMIEIIKRQLEAMKGKGAHSSIVLQTPTDCELTVEKLNVEMKEGSFRLIKADVAEDVMVAYGMPPYRIGKAKTGALAGNVADEMLRTYISAVVEPGQVMIEKMMNQVFVQGLGVENYTLKLKDLELWDEKAQAEINSIKIRTGQNTPNQLRREKGESEYIGGSSYFMEAGLIDIGEDDTE